MINFVEFLVNIYQNIIKNYNKYISRINPEYH